MTTALSEYHLPLTIMSHYTGILCVFVCAYLFKERQKISQAKMIKLASEEEDDDEEANRYMRTKHKKSHTHTVFCNDSIRQTDKQTNKQATILTN